jgi:nitric oxide dioxygenase
MTPAEIALVQSSFRQVVPIKEQAASIFYGRLFEIDPSTEPLFVNADMVEQGAKLMATLGMVVGALNQPEKVIPAAQALALRHVGYGVTQPQYASVGAALLWTLEKGLGPAYTPEIASAWASAYRLLSSVMVDATAP